MSKQDRNKQRSAPLHRVLLASFLFLTCGCDGFYAYDCDGDLRLPDGAIPPPGTPLSISSSRSDAAMCIASPAKSPAPPSMTQTDSAGHFRARIVEGTGWATRLRPPAPPLHDIWIDIACGPLPMALRVSVPAERQSITADGRHLDLGLIRMPTTQPK